MTCVRIALYRCVFFFSSRRRHTRCSRDWSSDVCSSDLPAFHDWNALNNTEERGMAGRADVGILRRDNPTRETVRRDKLVTAILPVEWFNDYGGLTVGLRTRQNYLGRFEQNLGLGSVATDGGATHRGGVYFRWANPIAHPVPRTTTSVAAWSVEGRTGAALRADRALRRTFVQRSDPHAGFDVLWMATTDLGYLDRRLWDDAGTFEAGAPGAATDSRGGALCGGPATRSAPW